MSNNNQPEHSQPLDKRIKRQLDAINAIQCRIANCPTCGREIKWRKSEMFKMYAQPCGHRL